MRVREEMLDTAGVFHLWVEKLPPEEEFEMWVGVALYALARARLIAYKMLARSGDGWTVVRENGSVRPNVFTRGGRNRIDLLIMKDAERILEFMKKS